MKEELKVQVEELQEDPHYKDLLDFVIDGGGSEAYFAEIYIQQESPFAEFELEE